MSNQSFQVPIEIVPSSGGGGSGTVTSVGTAGIATGGPITTSGTVTVAGSGNTTTAATAAANLAAAASGNVISTDGSGNVQSSGTLLSSLAPIASPTFTGTVTIPTAAITTASGNPNFSGTPTFANPVTLGASTATTQAGGTNNTTLATTAFVQSAIGASGAVTWGNIGNAAGNLSLSNAAFTTTFNQTSPVTWTWANTTAAVVGTNQNSPALEVAGTYFGSAAGVLAASAVDNWTIQNVLTPVQLSGTGSITTIAESAGSVVTLTTVANPFKAGALVEISGLSAGTWLNGYTVSLLTANAAGTSMTFNDPTAHGTLGSTGLTGTPVLTQVSGISALTLTETGVGGGTVVAAGGAGIATQFAGTTGTITAQNTTTATSGTTNASPALQFVANYWTGSASAQDLWTVNSSLAAGSAAAGNLTFTHTGTGNGNLFVNFARGAGNNFLQFDVSNTTQSITCPQPNTWFTINGKITNQGNTGGTGANGFNVQVADSGFAGTTTNGQQGALQLAGSFSPASGSTNFFGLQELLTINQTGTASGNYTGLLINAVETALLGTANKFITCQGGTTGGTTKFEVNNSGVIDNYNSVATVRRGIPSEIASSDLTAQAAAIAATTLIAAPTTGAYRVSWSAAITTVDGAASVLGGTNGFQVIYTSPTDSVVKTTVAGASVTSAGNTTGTATSGVLAVYAKAATNIQFSFGYTSTTPGQMVYELHISLEAL